MIFKIEGKYTASIIGSLFSLIIFISTFTLIIPILTLIFPGLLEIIFSSFIEPSKSKTIGIYVLASLIFIFIVTSYLSFKVIFKQKELLKNELLKYFTLQVFIIPSIFLYVKAVSNMEQINDGQFFFGIIEVFPLSSLSFIFIGILIDFIRSLQNKTEIIR